MSFPLTLFAAVHESFSGSQEVCLSRSLAWPVLKDKETNDRGSATHRIQAAIDPGRVKTPKGRSRRGIMSYRRRGFRIVLPLVARTLGLEQKAVLRVLHAPAF